MYAWVYIRLCPFLFSILLPFLSYHLIINFIVKMYTLYLSHQEMALAYVIGCHTPIGTEDSIFCQPDMLLSILSLTAMTYHLALESLLTFCWIMSGNAVIVIMCQMFQGTCFVVISFNPYCIPAWGRASLYLFSRRRMHACTSSLWIRKVSFRELRYSDSLGSLNSAVAEMGLQLFLPTKPMILIALLLWGRCVGSEGNKCKDLAH